MSATLAAPPAARPDADLLPEPGRGQELVDGELQERNVSYLSSFTAGRVFLRLATFADAHNLGWVAPEGTSFRCFPDDPTRVRRADTAFHRRDRLPLALVWTEGHCAVVPDLVVEVVSPNDLADDVNRKRVEWLAAGARLVWVVFPAEREVHAYPAGGPAHVFGPADDLTAEPVLPAFRTPIADLFPPPVSA